MACKSLLIYGVIDLPSRTIPALRYLIRYTSLLPQRVLFRHSHGGTGSDRALLCHAITTISGKTPIS